MRRLLGDAEALPFADDAFDRYVSAGSIEYWPDPQRGIAEAYRVLREGGVGVVIGPVRPAGRIARALADLWMLFPEQEQYRAWFERAGFADVAADAGGARLVPRRARAVRGRGVGDQAGGRPVAAGARAARRAARGAARPAARRALRRRASSPARWRAWPSCRSRW